MEFLDHSGHIFSLQSYDKKPIGFEYDESPYIFWINDTKDNQQISINNYYVRSINILFEIESNLYSDNIKLDNLLNIDITMDSKVFGFIPAATLQKTIQNGDINNIFTDYFHFNDTKITQHLTNNSIEKEHNEDIICIRINDENKHYVLIPIYVIGYAKEEGTWSTNIMIHISYKNNELEHNWCPITVGGVFVEKYESLIIHGKNMGVDLPHDILRAVNGTSFFGDNFDEALYNEKLKEYLINYIGIKAEKGNYNSINQSVKWFGYSKNVNISKLIKTDNEFKEQFIRDYFNIKLDLLDSYKNFINTQYVSLNMLLNRETDEHYEQNPTEEIKFWGEGLPILEGLINKKTIEYTNEFLKSEEYGYLSAYYLYSFNELGLKLACMKYYLEKYFFPIFIKIKSFSLEYKVYQNDIKFVAKTNTIATGGLVSTFNNNIDVKFLDSSIYYFTHQRRYVDDILNEFIIDPIIYNLEINPRYDEEVKKFVVDAEENQLIIDDIYHEDKEKWYLINDTCVSIPIIFKYDNKYYNCKLMLFQKVTDGYQFLYESQFSFIQNDNMRYNSFVFYPKLISQMQNNKSIYNCVNQSYKLCLLVNNKWYIKEFEIKTSEFKIDVGTIKYDYFFNDINYLWAKYKDATKNIEGFIDWTTKYDENDNQTHQDTKFENNSQRVIFKFNNDPEGSNEVDITQLITNFDFFDNPSRYMSNFRQIKKIDDKVIFNHYMHDTDFVNTNNLYFGYDLNTTNEDNSLTNQYQELLNSYQETINISNNSKYMNHIILYDLYIDSIINENVQIYAPVISTRVEGLLFSKEATEKGIHITGKPYLDNIETSQIDYYLHDEDNDFTNNLTPYGLYETQVYSFFLKVDADYNILPEFDTKPYSYVDSIVDLDGYIIFDSFEDFEYYKQNRILKNEFEYEITYRNGEYYIDDKKLIYKASFVDNEFNDIEVTLLEFNDAPYNYHIKIKFGYIESKQVLNYFGFIPVSYVNHLSDYLNDGLRYFNLNVNGQTGTCTLQVNDQYIDNVPLVNTKCYKYFVNEGEAKPSNPSFYWYSIDENSNIEDIYGQLNQLFIHNESEDGENWFKGIDNENTNFEILNNLNEDFVNIKYNNVLCKNLSGCIGDYKLSWESDNNKVKFCVSKNGEVLLDENNTIEFNIEENDNVFIYISVANSENQDINATITPTLYKIIKSFKKLEYIPKIRKKSEKEFNSTEEYNIYEQEYSIYEQEYNANIAELYKIFFTKAYSMIYRNGEEDEAWIDIWESSIPSNLINMYYDMYLMHDKSYWYIIYISKYTIDDLMLYYKDYNLIEKEIEYIKDDHQYVLKFVKTDNRFLINRMKFISANGINQFSKKELIAIRILNNSMLPLDTISNTKWEITPLSVGCDKNIKINGTTNLAVLSISNYDNEYKPGYYDIKVNYSTTFKYANFKELKSRILIK